MKRTKKRNKVSVFRSGAEANTFFKRKAGVHTNKRLNKKGVSFRGDVINNIIKEYE
tara:strand:+ start:406 stop:573 length:168 start_codon:yes stop_codon:yes gene_type:complete